MIDSKFLDSSVWITYLLNADEMVKDLIDKEGIFFTSILSIFEVKRKLIKEKVEIQKIQESLKFMREKSVIIALSADICEGATQWQLPAVDALIYESALKNKVHLFTYDNDFRGLGDVTIIE